MSHSAQSEPMETRGLFHEGLPKFLDMLTLSCQEVADLAMCVSRVSRKKLAYMFVRALSCQPLAIFSKGNPYLVTLDQCKGGAA